MARRHLSDSHFRLVVATLAGSTAGRLGSRAFPQILEPIAERWDLEAEPP
jgi:hypothetical protein